MSPRERNTTMKQKIKNIFKQLDLKNHPSTILTIVIEFILVSDIVIALGEVQ